MFEKYGPNRKTVINKMFFILIFTKVSENLVTGLLVTEIQNVREDIGLILYNINLFESMNNMKTKSSAKQLYF